jgi:hypothetical protein
MANIPGTILAAMISPGDTTATFATHEDIYGKGGLMTFTYLSSLSSIPLDRQKIGMLVYINETSEYYKVNTTASPLTDYSIFENGDIEVSTLVRTNSANWDAAYSSAGADLQVRALTGNWESTYTTVQSNSGSWNYQGTDLKGLSANWQTAYAYVSANSVNLTATNIFVNNNLTVTNTVSAKYYQGTLIDWMTLVRGYKTTPTLLATIGTGEVYTYVYATTGTDKTYYRYIATNGSEDSFYGNFSNPTLSNLITTKKIIL